MSRVGVDQDHQVVGEPRIFDVGVLAVTRGLLRPLQHPVHLGEVDVAEQWRDHPALRNALFSVGFEHDLQQMHDVGIVHALTYFRQQPIVPDIVEVAAQVDVYHACLLLNDRSRHTVYRFMGCPLWTVYPNDPGWKSASKIGSNISLSAPCTTLSRIAGIERTRTLPPSFGISCLRARSGT